MTSLAGLLTQAGCRVTGSDGKLYPPTSTVLAELGLTVHEGFAAENLTPQPDLVVIGNAVSRGNPEVEEVLDRKLDYTSMARLVGERFLAGRKSLVVAGTHGKTTTASMLAWVLYHAGRDPGFMIGGAPLNFKEPFRRGSGPFVIEGDEYDTAFFDKGPKFMHYRPDTVLLGTVEFDHADIYRDLVAVETAFRRLVNLVPRRGLVVRHEGSPITCRVTERPPCRIEGYGMEEGRWQAANLVERDGTTRFDLSCDGSSFATIELALGGPHNVRNALAVTAAAVDQGLSAAEVKAGLESFRGVRRRLELRGEADGVRVLDDFAHHPTAIRETLGAVRRGAAKGRVWAVLEPRSWSLRRNVFQERLTSVFDAADEVVLAPVFNPEAVDETERLDVPRLAQELVARGTSAHHFSDVAAILDHLAQRVAPEDTVVVMTNGAFEGFHGRLLERLERRAATAMTGSA